MLRGNPSWKHQYTAFIAKLVGHLTVNQDVFWAVTSDSQFVDGVLQKIDRHLHRTKCTFLHVLLYDAGPLAVRICSFRTEDIT